MKIIVTGCGRIGSELAELLDTDAHQVTVVDPEPENFKRLGAAFHGRTVTGIGFDRDVLVRAGIETADALAAVFPSDAVNVIVARVARDHYKVPMVVARLFDPRRAELYEPFGIQTVSSTTLSVYRMEQILTAKSLNHVADVGNGQVQVLEMRIPPQLAAQPVSQVLVTGEVTIVGLTRGGETFIPSPNTSLEEGDLLCLGVLTTAMGRLELMLRQGG